MQQDEDGPPAPTFFMHISQEFYLVVETRYDYILNMHQLHCPPCTLTCHLH